MKVTFLIFLVLCILPANVVFSMDDYMSPSDIEELTNYMTAGMSFEEATKAVRDRLNQTTYAAANLDERNARLGDAEMTIVMRLMEETGMGFEGAIEAMKKGKNSSGAIAAVAQEEMDTETAALIAMLNAENYPQLIQYPEGSVFHIVRSHRDINVHRDTLAPLITFLTGIKRDANVHSLDAHVTANIAKLPIIGNAFGVDNPNLTKAYMLEYLLERSDFYAGYEGQHVTKAQLTQYLNAALTTASTDTTTFSIYSRVVSLIQCLENEGFSEGAVGTYLQDLFDAVSENYLTQGGCFQGVRNRAYVRYVAMLNNLMGMRN